MPMLRAGWAKPRPSRWLDSAGLWCVQSGRSAHLPRRPRPASCLPARAGGPGVQAPRHAQPRQRGQAGGARGAVLERRGHPHLRQRAHDPGGDDRAAAGHDARGARGRVPHRPHLQVRRRRDRGAQPGPRAGAQGLGPADAAAAPAWEAAEPGCHASVHPRAELAAVPRCHWLTLPALPLPPPAAHRSLLRTRSRTASSRGAWSLPPTRAPRAAWCWAKQRASWAAAAASAGALAGPNGQCLPGPGSRLAGGAAAAAAAAAAHEVGSAWSVACSVAVSQASEAPAHKLFQHIASCAGASCSISRGCSIRPTTLPECV
jgi:hypothetical protein